jgi:hypothetical protein
MAMQEYLNQQFPLGPGDLSLHPAGVLDDVADLREESAEAPGGCRSNLRSSAGFAGASCLWGRLGGGPPYLDFRRGPLRRPSDRSRTP